MNKLIITGLLTGLQLLTLRAQKRDTLNITAGNMNVSNLKAGKSRYLVYMKNNKDAPSTDIQIWNIEVEKINHHGKKTISVKQNWDYKDSVVHTSTSVCEEAGFKPIYHAGWWKGRGSLEYDIIKNELSTNGKLITETDSSKRNKSAFDSFKTSFNHYYLNWHLDLEVFTMLPYKANRTFAIPFYELGYSRPEKIYYSVAGVAVLNGYNSKKITCWLLKHEEKGNQETYWISSETNEVLKLEQVINDTLYRYKIKLPY